MYKHLRLLMFFCLLAFVSKAQVQSPEQFLGYKVGTRFTPHWKIVSYFQHIASTAPTLVKLQQYGITNEGRPLVTAFISTSDHIANLESIRKNNLGLAGMDATKTANTNTPAIVWLSYNVHGNETSSSEVAMLTLYALVDPANNQTKEWLKNTVVVIDPCLNPDGRDRYVNWFNSVAGRTANPSLDAREHSEPWPGGRTNHYNFDLNRDWAWQTQIESQQRVLLYNQWLPQIHVDFHEQEINNPYYFAPAAEPYHEVITPWQRKFQEVIGRNHARYFDEKGWLYFTKEVFDLLYPSYGDTYPLYNGSIGMTYEQAGHSQAGTAVVTASGDTLTLNDRIAHHLTTGLSTIEAASKYASELLKEFQRFFVNAGSNGVGDYKTYIIKYSDNNRERMKALTSLLTKNGIQYGRSKNATYRGFNYDNGRDESFALTANDIVVSSYQPKGTLVKVLFEPKSILADTATYDITAWSLPYVYGVKAYATKERMDVTETTLPAITNTAPTDEAYGYVIRWSGMESAKLVAQLLQKGVRLRYTQKPFETGGQQFDRGAILILKGSNQQNANLWKTVFSLANTYGVPLTAVRSGFVDKGFDFGSSSVLPLKKPSVALLTGTNVNANAAGEIWHFFDQVLEYPVTLINAAELNETNWQRYDVLIMPDGYYKMLDEKSGADGLKDWISRGGKLIALEGAVRQLAQTDWSIKLKKEDTAASKDPYAVLKKYETRERDYISNMTPGSIFKVDLDNTHPLAFGFPPYYYTLKQDNAIYDFIKEGGWNVGVIKREKQIAGFVGSKLAPRLQDGLLFGTQEIGRGTAVYFADNVLFRSFWENGKLLFTNALFLAGQ